MNKRFLQALLVLSLAILVFQSGCSTETSLDELQATAAIGPVGTATVAPPAVTDPSDPLAEAAAKVDYPVATPDESLLQGYVLDGVDVDDTTQSVCLRYRYPAPGGDSLLFLAQGPLDASPTLEKLPDAPEYLLEQQAVEIGGAENSLHVAGLRRKAWACSAAAEQENTRFSFALAPWLTWQADGRQFDLYSASGGCATPGGMTNLDLLRVAESITGQSTIPADERDPDCLLSITDAEKLAGIDIKEPAYLPEKVRFYYATVDEGSDPSVTLLYLHEDHPDMGRFFQITQFKSAPTYFLSSCDQVGSSACETLQFGDTPVVYQSSGPSEQLDWQMDGQYFSLFRSAGEPGVVYKDELLKVAGSMK
jgi:hypothetical protein